MSDQDEEKPRAGLGTGEKVLIALCVVGMIGAAASVVASLRGSSTRKEQKKKKRKGAAL